MSAPENPPKRRSKLGWITLFFAGLLSPFVVLILLQFIPPGWGEPSRSFDKELWDRVGEESEYGDLRRLQMLDDIRSHVAYRGAPLEEVVAALGPGSNGRGSGPLMRVYWLGIKGGLDSWWLHVRFTESRRVMKATTHKY